MVKRTLVVCLVRPILPNTPKHQFPNQTGASSTFWSLFFYIRAEGPLLLGHLLTVLHLLTVTLRATQPAMHFTTQNT